jgi:hypothetical protein
MVIPYPLSIHRQSIPKYPVLTSPNNTPNTEPATHTFDRVFAQAFHITIRMPILRQILSLDKPILATGGGGYHVENTVRGCALAWSMLSGNEIDEDAAAGMGGVMLANTDWLGGLRDRVIIPTEENKCEVEPVLADTIARVRHAVSPYHGLRP